jgi:hypothetical protein
MAGARRIQSRVPGMRVYSRDQKRQVNSLGTGATQCTMVVFGRPHGIGEYGVSRHQIGAMRCHLLMKDGNLKVQRRGVTFFIAPRRYGQGGELF